MRKTIRKSNKKIQKNNFEERFAAMVKEYQDAKEVLDSIEQDSPEYMNQKKVCEKLFASAERYINKTQ